jgi:sporulation protein YlmC with PRC-barrel domain
MKKYPFILFSIVVLLFSSTGSFAKANASSGMKGVMGDMPKNNHVNAFRVDKIIGSRVINLEGENIGTIDNLVLDVDTGDILYAALEFGGFMDIGDKLFAVPWQSLTAVPAEGIFILDQSKKKLEKAPGFDKNHWPDIGDKAWEAGIYAFYRHRVPYHRNAEAPVVPQRKGMHPGNRRYPEYTGSSFPGVWGDPFGEMFDPKTVQTVTGEIVRIEYSAGTRLMIYTDQKKPVLVTLGPTDYFTGQGRILKTGDKITVTGSKVVVDDTPYIIATKVKTKNKELTLRDKKGEPVWLGWKPIK